MTLDECWSCRRAAARQRGRITAVIPYFGYARQAGAARDPCRQSPPSWCQHDRVPASVACCHRLHADRSRGSSHPGDNVYASPVLLGDAWKQKYRT